MLAHPSVKVLGHRNDVPELMRKSDILVLPSIEEGFGLVITEAMGSGCVPLASEACTEICSHMKTGLMHRVGDVEALTQHITMLHEDRALLERLRAAVSKPLRESRGRPPGKMLLDVYRETIAAHRAGAPHGDRSRGVESGRLPIEADCFMNPKVSVVIPTYNRAAKVPHAIESVLAQTVTDLEVIVVDDGSSDDTGKILGEIFGDRIRYYAQANQGASVARNKGIDGSAGRMDRLSGFRRSLGKGQSSNGSLRPWSNLAPQCGGCYTDIRFFNHPETRTMFQMAENELSA